MWHLVGFYSSIKYLLHREHSTCLLQRPAILCYSGKQSQVIVGRTHTHTHKVSLSWRCGKVVCGTTLFEFRAKEAALQPAEGSTGSWDLQARPCGDSGGTRGVSFVHGSCEVCGCILGCDGSQSAGLVGCATIFTLFISCTLLSPPLSSSSLSCS